MYKIKPISNKDKSYALKWFSKYIRLRDAIATTNTDYQAVCITCDKTFDILEMDAGHMIPGRTNAILFDEDIVHAQCRSCNRVNQGEKQAYRLKMIEKHSQDWYDIKVSNKNKPCKLNYRLIGEYYKDEYKKIKSKFENNC